MRRDPPVSRVLVNDDVGVRTAPSSARRTPAPIACAARSDWSPSSSRWTWTKTRVAGGAGPEVVEAARRPGGRRRSARPRRPAPGPPPGPSARSRPRARCAGRPSHQHSAGGERHHRVEPETPKRRGDQRDHRPERRQQVGRGSAAGRPRRCASRSRRATRPCQARAPRVTATDTAMTASPGASAVSAGGAARRPHRASSRSAPAEAATSSAWPRATRSSAELCPNEWSSSGGRAA